jgi:LEA14-like dessication related protein
MKVINKPLSSFAMIAYCMILFACVPKEELVFKGVSDIVVDVSNGKPVLKGNGYFYNPNKVKIKLKEINVEVFVDGTKSANVKHDLDVTITGKSDFTVPIVAELVLKQDNFLDAVVGLLGGKKYEVVFKGYIRIKVHGFPIKVPVAQKQELKLNI